MNAFYLDAGKLGLKEFCPFVKCLQPAPLSPACQPNRDEVLYSQETEKNLFIPIVRAVFFFMLVSLLTRSKEQRYSPDAGLHELRVDAHHVGSRQAVLVIAVADGVNPGQVGHVAEQNHPLEKRLLGLMTTCRINREVRCMR